jgi:hypothetical protein
LTSELDHGIAPAYSPEDAEEPEQTLHDAILEHGESAVLKALGRVLLARRKTLRLEGELAAAKAVRKVASACIGHAEELSDEGV